MSCLKLGFSSMLSTQDMQPFFGTLFFLVPYYTKYSLRDTSYHWILLEVQENKQGRIPFKDLHMILIMKLGANQMKTSFVKRSICLLFTYLFFQDLVRKKSIKTSKPHVPLIWYTKQLRVSNLYISHPLYVTIGWSNYSKKSDYTAQNLGLRINTMICIMVSTLVVCIPEE